MYMSIFGSAVKEPKNFDVTKFFKVFQKYYAKEDHGFMSNVDVLIKEDRWSLNSLLLKSSADKNQIKAIEKLVKTGTVVKNGNDILLDAEFMMNVVEPLAYARLNPEKTLSKKILKTLDCAYVCNDGDFYNSLSDEEAKLMAVRTLKGYDSYSIYGDMKQLVLNSELATLADISIVFKNKTLSKEEVSAIWGKLKPRLLELTADDFMPKYTRKFKDGVQYLELRGAIDNNGKYAFLYERQLLEKICTYLQSYIEEFACDIKDKVTYLYEGKEYVTTKSLWNPYNKQCEYIKRAFVERLDDTIKFKLPAAMEKDTVKKLQLEKDGLDKQMASEIQAIKDFVAARKVKIQSIKAEKQEVEGKLKAIEEENKRKEAERARAELQQKQAEFEAMAAKLGVNPADLLALQQKSQNQR